MSELWLKVAYKKCILYPCFLVGLLAGFIKSSVVYAWDSFSAGVEKGDIL